MTKFPAKGGRNRRYAQLRKMSFKDIMNIELYLF